MKRFILESLVGLLAVSFTGRVLAAGDCKSYFDVTGDVAQANALAEKQKDAQALNKAGDVLATTADYVGAAGKYEAAAKLHPVSEISAFYYWKAASATVGHLDDNKDWAINPTFTATDKAEALRLLGLATAALATPSGYCHTSVDVDTLNELIAKVTACVNGHCK